MAAEELEGRGYGSGYGRCVRPCDGLRKARQVWVPARSGCKGGMVEDIHLRGSGNFSMLGIFVSSRQALKTLSRQNHRSISSRTENQSGRGPASQRSYHVFPKHWLERKYGRVSLLHSRNCLKPFNNKPSKSKVSMSFLFTHKLIVPPIDISTHTPNQTSVVVHNKATHSNNPCPPTDPYNRSHVH